MGVVAEVSFTSLRLEDGRSFEIERDLQCFSTYTLEPLPLLGREGQFVHLGTQGRKVRWIASIGAVTRGDDPAVFYTGTVEAVTPDRLTFRDGTVIGRGRGVDPPAKGSFVVVEVDPRDGTARRVTPA